METILCSLLLSAAEDTGFATSSSPFYLTTNVCFEEAQEELDKPSLTNDEAALSFGIGTMASDSLIVEAMHYQTNDQFMSDE